MSGWLRSHRAIRSDWLRRKLVVSPFLSACGGGTLRSLVSSSAIGLPTDWWIGNAQRRCPFTSRHSTARIHRHEYR